MQDQLEQKKELNKELNLLKARKELAERELRGVLDTIETLNGKYDSLTEKILSCESVMESTLEEGFNAVTQLVTILKEGENIFEKYKVVLQNLDEELLKREGTLKDLELKSQGFHQVIIRQQRLIASQLEDLDIYKKRVDKAYTERLPNQKVIL